MLNKNKIFIILAIIILLFFFYYIFSVKTVVLKKPATQDKAENIAALKKLSMREKLELKNNYNSKIADILSRYEENLEKIKEAESDDDNFYENLDALKLEALALIVPGEYKNTHLEIALIFSRINELCAKDKVEENFNLINELLAQAGNLKSNLKNL
ncbi:hypothetical protein KAU09_04525 [Candidatus Parcubacteria bacterium]|nr:hypothetical protein [Candidatus Parcubacteria bacterium]